jgi:hypothetical protein
MSEDVLVKNFKKEEDAISFVSKAETPDSENEILDNEFK